MSLGELPPPAPRDCFGRDELIEKVVGLAESLEPIALIGAGGIGKTSIALAVLHHNRIENRFGENRRFIRCDQFPASRHHFLARLSKVIGAGVENPEDLTPLRPLLSSKEMLIILDNAESILDSKGSGAREIYALVNELSQFKKVSLCITSRITTVPRHCKRTEIPTLSIEAARDIFYSIHDNLGRPGIIDNLLQRLDFHALSITLLATTASHNAWDYDRLAKEWDTQRARVLQTDYNESLAATIELSLSSPTFQSLGPNARDLLAVVAFFPQGINENNLDWLFPTISDKETIFDKFCVLSLTHRSNGFITMLAPIRDYLGPQDPQSSPLLCATRDRYFRRLSVEVDPGRPGFVEARWIVLEDVNVEHLLDVFTSFDQNTDEAWGACDYFMKHLYWHTSRQTLLGPKIQSLPNDHPYKSRCLYGLSRLFQRVGNYAEQKRLLAHTLKLERERGDGLMVAQVLTLIADSNLALGLYKEGIPQAREALEIFQRTGDTIGRADCSTKLTWLLLYDGQFDAAQNAASHEIDLTSEKGQESNLSKLHRALGKVFYSKGNKEKAFHHFNTALSHASTYNFHTQLFWIYFDMAVLFRDQGEHDNAHTHIERAKAHAVDDIYALGRAMKLEAEVWYSQNRFEDAKSEALRALENYEKSGAARDVEICTTFLQVVEQAMRNRPTNI